MDPFPRETGENRVQLANEDSLDGWRNSDTENAGGLGARLLQSILLASWKKTQACSGGSMPPECKAA